MGRRNGRRYEWLGDLSCLLLLIVLAICGTAIMIATIVSDTLTHMPHA